MLLQFNSLRSILESGQNFAINCANAIIEKFALFGVDAVGRDRMIQTVQGMSDPTHIQKILNFLTEPTARKSVREYYYQHSDFIAEYFCTLSNLGLFAVGFYYRDEAALLAATFSALSHAIPSQRLHDLDMLGVVAVLTKVASNYEVLLKKPSSAAWGAGALAINFIDTMITRKYLDSVGPSIHVIWHLASAFAMHKFNEAKNELSAEPTETSRQIKLQGPPLSR